MNKDAVRQIVGRIEGQVNLLQGNIGTVPADHLQSHATSIRSELQALMDEIDSDSDSDDQDGGGDDDNDRDAGRSPSNVEEQP